jgi:hypothetical protein
MIENLFFGVGGWGVWAVGQWILLRSNNFKIGESAKADSTSLRSNLANKLFISDSELTSLTRAQNSLLGMSASGRYKDMSMYAEEFLPLLSAGFHA